MIRALMNSLGIQIGDPAELKSMVTKFYKTLYTSKGVNDMEAVLNHVPRKVTREMNASLVQIIERKKRKQHCLRCSQLNHLGQMAFLRIFIRGTGMYVVKR